MREIKYRRARKVTKFEALLEMLTSPGTPIQGDEWEPFEWCVATTEKCWDGTTRPVVRDENDDDYSPSWDRLEEQWWIMEPIPESERLEAERAQLVKELAEIDAKIAAAKEANP